MRTGSGLLALAVRLISGRLRHEVTAFARREVRLVAIAAIGFVIFLAFFLGAAGIAVALFYALLEPYFGALASYGILIGAMLAIAVISLLIAMRTARAIPHWEVKDQRTDVAISSKPSFAVSRQDLAIAFVIGALLGSLVR